MIEQKKIKDQYFQILDRIAEACKRAGRSSQDVTLVAVSKTFSQDYIAALYDLGHRDFGESKVQELVQKATAFSATGHHEDIRWHMIGHLQRNKVRDVLPVTSLIHSVDSVRLVKELDRRAAALNVSTDCLVQVNISGEASKYGLESSSVASFLSEIDDYKHVRIRGFMGMAAPLKNSNDVRPQFELLRDLLKSCAGGGEDSHEMSVLSIGMSNDFEVAVESGATHVRIGSAIFGARSVHREP